MREILGSNDENAVLESAVSIQQGTLLSHPQAYFEPAESIQQGRMIAKQWRFDIDVDRVDGQRSTCAARASRAVGGASSPLAMPFLNAEYSMVCMSATFRG